jgi:hypothetical protein
MVVGDAHSQMNDPEGGFAAAESKSLGVNPNLRFVSNRRRIPAIIPSSLERQQWEGMAISVPLLVTFAP